MSLLAFLIRVQLLPLVPVHLCVGRIGSARTLIIVQGVRALVSLLLSLCRHGELRLCERTSHARHRRV